MIFDQKLIIIPVIIYYDTNWMGLHNIVIIFFNLLLIFNTSKIDTLIIISNDNNRFSILTTNPGCVENHKICTGFVNRTRSVLQNYVHLSMVFSTAQLHCHKNEVSNCYKAMTTIKMSAKTKLSQCNSPHTSRYKLCCS